METVKTTLVFQMAHAVHPALENAGILALSLGHREHSDQALEGPHSTEVKVKRFHIC